MQRRVEAVLQMEWHSKKATANPVDNALKFASEGGRTPVALIQQEGETERPLVCSICRFSIRSAVGWASGHRGRGCVLLDEILSL
jgi:hypothetical protein